jgi:capsular exopolysaccharide synthesis family protein
MSNIFDALQKSEAEFCGSDSPEVVEATELLRRAERRATARWESSADPVQPAVVAQETSAAADALAAIEGVGDFGDIQSLKMPQNLGSRLVSVTDTGSSAAEAFRLLGVRLRHRQRELAIKRLLITSTVPREGKSLVSANLACTLALKGEQKVLLVEGDLRRPSLMELFGLDGNPGLCECFGKGRRLVACIYRLRDPGIWILPAGQVTNNAPHLLQSEWLSPVMDRLNEWFDWVIIDSPPVLPLADTSVWARLADGIILVTRQGVTEKRGLLRGVEALDRQKLIGALVNCSRYPAHSDYYYGYSKKASKAREG